MSDLDYVALATQFWDQNYHAITLFGSHARGNAGPFSDVDLNIIAKRDEQAKPPETHLIDNRLVVVSTFTPKQVEEWFNDPATVGEAVGGIRQARALIDPDSHFAAIQTRAEAFTWTDSLRAAATRELNERMVGWIEEMHKGMEGLERNDAGRMIHSLFGAVWGLSKVLHLHYGTLLTTDNEFQAVLFRKVGYTHPWSQSMLGAIGMSANNQDTFSLRQRVRAGLQTYVETVYILVADDALMMPQAALIQATAAKIETFLKATKT